MITNYTSEYMSTSAKMDLVGKKWTWVLTPQGGRQTPTDYGKKCSLLQPNFVHELHPILEREPVLRT
jgi:hypothetical protein